jgi:tripartite-type tricarboxylate transporter receptor subunit TctC
MCLFKRMAGIGLLAALACLPVVQVVAQEFPQRPVKMIVPYPPGGGIDPVARVVAGALSRQLGQSVIVENISGASGRIGTASAARAKPDGYTLLFGSGAPNAILPAAYGAQLSYDARKDFIPIGLVAQVNYVLVVTTSLPVQSLQDLIDYAKAHPKTLTYASSGFLSGPYLAGELLGKMAQIDLMHVPYQGTGPALAGVMGGVTSMMFETEGNIVTKAPSGKFRVLAVTGSQASAFPDAPNLGKRFPGHNVSQWYGVLTVAGTPPDVVARLSDALAKAARSAEVKQQIGNMGLAVIQDSTPDSFNSYITSEIERWKFLIRTAGIPVPPL